VIFDERVYIRKIEDNSQNIYTLGITHSHPPENKLKYKEIPLVTLSI